MDIEKILIHEGYDNRTKIHDIALIRFSREITNYRINIRPVCLRWTPESPNPAFLPTHKFIAVGWGRTLNGESHFIHLRFGFCPYLSLTKNPLQLSEAM